MATDLATSTQDISPQTLEQVVVNGDLSRLSPAQKLQWYRARCDAAGLDPRTQPFQYLSLQGRLTLYATKAATDQLIASRRLNVEIIERRHDRDLGVYEVQCRVTFPDGRKVEDFAALTINGLKGDALCNALMKAVTKAKRRTVLSACGLGMLDETEVDTIPDARIVSDDHHAKYHDNGTGHGSGAYARPETVKAYADWCRSYVDDVNAKWLDALTDKAGNINATAELVSTWQLTGHLLKFARANAMVNAPEQPAASQRDKFVAVVWERSRPTIEEEAAKYCRQLWRDAKAKMQPALPAPLPADDDSDGEPIEVEDDGDVWAEGRE